MDPAQNDNQNTAQAGQNGQTASSTVPQQSPNPLTSTVNMPQQEPAQSQTQATGAVTGDQFDPTKNTWTKKNDPLHPHFSKPYGQSAGQTNPSAQSETHAPMGRINPASLSEFGPQNKDEPMQPGQVIKNSDEPSSKSKKGRVKLILFFFLLIIFLAVSGSGVLAYLIAYEKIETDKYPDLQKKVTYAIQSLPFMPKTPKFLLAKSALAHQDVTKQTYNLSLAIDSDDLVNSLGVNSFDIEAKGAVDYSNPKDILFTLDTSITKDFNFELRKKDEFLYFRINKLPSLILSVLGMKSEDFSPLLGQWVAYDTTPLDTEARRNLQDKEVDPLSEEYIDENFNKFIDDTVTKEFKLEESQLNGRDVYKITLDADDELVDHIGRKLEEELEPDSGSTLRTPSPSSTTEPEKLSDVIKEFHMELFIDQKDYFNRKSVITAKFVSESTAPRTGSPFIGSPSVFDSSKSEVDVAFAAEFDNFGEPVYVEIPQSTITFEEFTNRLSEVFRSAYGSYINETSNTSLSASSDTRVVSDLTTITFALEAYYVTCRAYPDDLLQLTDADGGCAQRTEAEMFAVPTLPSGEDYYYQVSADKQNYDLCGKLETPPSSNSVCPDPSYNFHTTGR